METLLPYQWLYILYVLVGIFIGILGIRATIDLIKGKENAESAALVALILGIVTGGTHMLTSRALGDPRSQLILSSILQSSHW